MQNNKRKYLKEQEEKKLLNSLLFDYHLQIKFSMKNIQEIVFPLMQSKSLNGVTAFALQRSVSSLTSN